MESAIFSRVLALCLSSTYFASTAIRRILKSGQLGIVDKGSDDLQTEADRFAQKTIVLRLRHHFPALKVIGEEGELQDSTSEGLDNDEQADALEREVLGKKCPEQFREARLEDMVIWVDPLDGTKEFTQGLLDHVTVLVGVAVRGQAVAGVISQPYFNFENKAAEPGRLIWGGEGLGVFGLTPKLPTADRLVVTTSRSHGTSVVDKAVNSLEPAEVLRVGGSGHKVLLLLEGVASAYVFASKGTKKWDTCAPEALLHAVGGRMTDILGRALPYDANARHGNNEGLFATARAEDHAKLQVKLPEEVLSQFRN